MYPHCIRYTLTDISNEINSKSMQRTLQWNDSLVKQKWLWTEPFSLLNHIVRKLFTSFRGLYGIRLHIMVQHMEGMRAYSKHGLFDYKNDQLEIVLSLIGIYQKYFK